MTQTLKPLLDLQEVDTAHDRLVERLAKLPEKAELDTIGVKMDDVRASILGVEAEADAIIKEMNRLENELVAVEHKITEEEAKLYGGGVSNPKELSALQSEIEMLKRKKAPLEEGAIEQMMSRDERYEQRSRLEADLAALDRDAQVLRDKIKEAAGDIDVQIHTEESKRAVILPQIPADILELYESLRESKKGIGAGALSGGACTACRETLSAVELDRIRQAAKAGETMFRCEHCRRILVVA